MNTQEKIVVLKAARKLIEKPEHWGSRSFALDDKDLPVPVSDKRAVCFCSAGAIMRAVGDTRTMCAAYPAVEELAVGLPDGECTLPQTKVYEWNDYVATHEQVLAQFDATIARLELSLTP